MKRKTENMIKGLGVAMAVTAKKQKGQCKKR